MEAFIVILKVGVLLSIILSAVKGPGKQKIAEAAKYKSPVFAKANGNLLLAKG